jgi:hypothetical protein
MREVELKLEIRREDAARLMHSPRLRELAEGRATRACARLLRHASSRSQRHGARVRRDDRRLVQTFKARTARGGALRPDRYETVATAGSPTSRSSRRDARPRRGGGSWRGAGP